MNKNARGPVWYAPIDRAGNLGYQYSDKAGAEQEANARIRIYGSPWRVARLEWNAAEVYDMTKPDRIVRV